MNVGAASSNLIQRPDWTIDQGWGNYTSENHAVWKMLFDRQVEQLAGRACDEFVAGMNALPLGREQIPDFDLLSQVLVRNTGWQIVAVPGLVPDDVFFDHLAHRRFPAGNFIRDRSQLDYLEEPDVFHDVFGHVPMLMNPVFADYVQAYGIAAQRAREVGALDKLASMYWFTVEFGLVRQADGLKIYGAGIASSYTESLFALDDDSPNRIKFDLMRVMRTTKRIDDFQETYFVIDDLAELFAFVDCVTLDTFYRQITALPTIDPSERVYGDHILHRGSGRYHEGKKGYP
ncbi:phenylalanine 4-monooxygenase, partial [uncultured Caballeronia sp.]|uniref:phenylalanine 4-monooxygenase n=1 Tax=uncultured Caballeronia sp. TaxID=1827198 RepID=UPI0035CC300F